MAISISLTHELLWSYTNLHTKKFQFLWCLSVLQYTHTRVQLCMHLYTPLVCPEIKMLQFLIDCSKFCVISGLMTITMYLKMLRMTHLGNKLLVLLVQVSSGSHIVSPYSQPAFLGKPDNKARMQIIQTDQVSKGNPPSPWQQTVQNPILDKAPRRKTTSWSGTKCVKSHKKRCRATVTIQDVYINHKPMAGRLDLNMQCFENE